MNKYEVTIKATIWKFIEVDAETEEEASELAAEMFTPECNHICERYEEETIEIRLK